MKSCTRNKYKEVGDEVANEPLLGDVWAVIKEFSKRPIPSDGVSDGSDGSADASAGGLRRSKRKLYSAEKVGAVHVDVQLPDMQDKEDSQQELLSECDARPALRGKKFGFISFAFKRLLPVLSFNGRIYYHPSSTFHYVGRINDKQPLRLTKVRFTKKRCLCAVLVSFRGCAVRAIQEVENVASKISLLVFSGVLSES